MVCTNFINADYRRLHLITRYAGAVSLRLGPLAVLTVHRTVIHYRSCRFATLKGKADKVCTEFKVTTVYDIFTTPSSKAKNQVILLLKTGVFL